MENLEFYQDHLNEVSRSFSFCIQKLSSPMRQWTSLSYLLLRILDTIEDSTWSNADHQKKKYLGFESFMCSMPEREIVQREFEKFPENIPNGERKLLDAAYRLFNDLHTLPGEVRLLIQSAASQMSQGMQHYSHKRTQSEGAVIQDLRDLNRYCYFAAGVVGQLLEGLYQKARPDLPPAPKRMKNSVHFGIFLQKINILKDQLADEKESRYWLPDRQLVLSSLGENARGALDYLISLPLDEKGYREFCAISLFLGLASLPWIQQSYYAADVSKLPRSEALILFSTLESIAMDNGALEGM